MNTKNEMISVARSPWTFLASTLVLTWSFWLIPLLDSHGMLALSDAMVSTFTLVGSFMPFCVAFSMKYRTDGWSAMGNFAKRALRWRANPLYFIAALLLIPALGLGAAFIYDWLGGPSVQLGITLSYIPVLFVIMFLSAGRSTRSLAGRWRSTVCNRAGDYCRQRLYWV